MLAIAAGSLLAWGIPSHAQPGGRTATIEEIVVTAQKREESLQDAPISIVALGPEMLENQGIRSITDLGEGAVPNLRIAPFGGSSASHLVTIRGISAQDPGQIARESPTGIYLDGVYLGRAQGLGIDQLDLERIEVLRGPQGTLFGRNALGGAISLVSKKPSGEFGFAQTLGVGNMGFFNSVTRLDLPEFAGISAKIDYMTSNRDGWVKNPARGQDDWSAFDKSGGRVSLLWQAADNVTVAYAYDKSRNEEIAPYMHLDRLFAGAPPFPEGGFQQLEPHRVSRGRTGALNEPSVSKVEGHTLNLTWDISDNHTLRAISAYRELEQTMFNSYAGGFYRPGPATGNLFGRISLSDVEQDQVSHELQWLGSMDRVEFVLGAFYYKETAEDAQSDPFGNMLTPDGPIVLPAPRYTRPAPGRATEMTAESRALFGQAKWTPDILENRFSVTVGARYTQDKKDGTRLYINGTPAHLPYKYDENRFDPAVTLAYDWNEQVNTYLRWSTAYRGGGINTRSESFRPFDADEVESWELGFKSELWDRRVRLNTSLFRTEWNDQQVDFTAPTASSPSNGETINAGNTVTYTGLEADATIVPVAGLTLNLSYGYLDVDSPLQYNYFIDRMVKLGPVLAPRHSGAVSAEYEFEPTAFGTVRAYLGMKYSDAYRFSPNSPEANTDGYTLWDARLTLSDIPVGSTRSNLRISLWGKNLTDEEYFSYHMVNLRNAPLVDAASVSYNTPRTYGLDITYTY